MASMQMQGAAISEQADRKAADEAALERSKQRSGANIAPESGKVINAADIFKKQ